MGFKYTFKLETGNLKHPLPWHEKERKLDIYIHVQVFLLLYSINHNTCRHHDADMMQPLQPQAEVIGVSFMHT